jgi:hypothetical protein
MSLRSIRCYASATNVMAEKYEMLILETMPRDTFSDIRHVYNFLSLSSYFEACFISQTIVSHQRTRGQINNEKEEPTSPIYFEERQNIYSPALQNLLTQANFSFHIFVSISTTARLMKNTSSVHYTQYFLMTVPSINSVAASCFSIPSAVCSTQHSPWSPSFWQSFCSSPLPLLFPALHRKTVSSGM